jgi:lysophospholipid acyltransferase (LPLAT)-like uncharacterized protein
MHHGSTQTGMTETLKGPDTSDGEARRNPLSGRQMTPVRRLVYAIATPLIRIVVALLWRSCRVQPVQGVEYVEKVVASEAASVPCFWHRDILVCLLTMRQWIDRGFKAGVVISASVDGEVPSRIASSWGAVVIRGSASRTGALAMRDMHQVMKDGTSIISAADGPVGPAYYFKSGVVLTARIGSAPLLPIGCAADRAWYLKRWDDFMIPKPFAKIAVAVGEPYSLPRGASKDELESARITMQNAVIDLVERSKLSLARKQGETN